MADLSELIAQCFADAPHQMPSPQRDDDDAIDDLAERLEESGWDENAHPRDEAGKFTYGGKGHFTPEAGGTLLHGTRRAFTRWTTPEAYLTDDFDEATGYAHGMHLGGRGGRRPPMVRTLDAKPGKTLNVQEDIDDAVMNGDDLDFKGIFDRARADGARYVEYMHPSNVSGDREQRVIVSLYPNEDLKFTGGWQVKKKP